MSNNLDWLRGQIETKLRREVRRGLIKLTAECLGSQDVTLLSALNVDAYEKLLQIFKEEAEILLNNHKGETDAR